MPRLALIEAVVATAVQAVLDGGKVEDERIECKAEMIPPDRVRQLAGAANAAMGDDLIWIVGIDEENSTLVPIDQSLDPADWWASVQSNFEDAVTPDLTFLWVPVAGGRVLALHFSTDRAPYLVKRPGGGSPELEIPWRDGTRTRSAKRHELLRMLLPTVRVPEVTVLALTGTISAASHLQFNGTANVYIEHVQEHMVVLPTHQMTAVLNLFGADYRLNVQPTLGIAPLSAGVEQTRDGVYCRGPGMARLSISGTLAGIEQDTPERLRDLERVPLRLELGLAGGLRPIRIDVVLASKFDRSQGPTLNIPLDIQP